MSWRLPQHVSFCWVEGQAVFLDVGRDRYFALPAEANAAFASWASQPHGEPPEILARHAVFTIPMLSGKVRSLNLATSAGIVLYEGMRQLHGW